MADEDFHLGADVYSLGADVYSADGHEVGKLVHLIVGPDYGLRALVVKENSAFSAHSLAPTSWMVADEFVVPKDAATKVTRERVDVRLSAADLRRLPPYVSYRERGESVAEVLEDTAGVLGSGPELPNWMEQVANKGPDELEIDGGENVMAGRSGRRLGTVKDVLFEGEPAGRGRAPARRVVQARGRAAAAFSGPQRRYGAVREHRGEGGGAADAVPAAGVKGAGAV